jgi:hypothetical protein
MRLLHYSLIVGCLTALTWSVAERSSAAPPDERPPNAALAYWQAFAGMSYEISPELKERIAAATTDEGMAKPVDGELAQALADAEVVLVLDGLHRGAGMPYCDWQSPLEEDGINTLLPHLQKARELARVSLLRARYRFEHNQAADGITDVLDTVAMGRDLTEGGTLVSQLVSYAIERMAYSVLAAYLPKVSDDLLRAFPKQLDSLPPVPPIAEPFAKEQFYVADWFVRRWQEATHDGRRKLCRMPTGSDEESDRLWKELSESDITKIAEEIRGLYALIPGLAALPPGELQAAYDSRIKPVLERNPLAKALFPSDPKVIRAEQVYHCSQQLLRAAIAVRLEGKEALAQFRDPFGDGPFEMTNFDGGFELRSKYPSTDNVPLMLRAGILRD